MVKKINTKLNKFQSKKSLLTSTAFDWINSFVFFCLLCIQQSATLEVKNLFSFRYFIRSTSYCIAPSNGTVITLIHISVEKWITFLDFYPQQVTFCKVLINQISLFWFQINSYFFKRTEIILFTHESSFLIWLPS